MHVEGQLPDQIIWRLRYMNLTGPVMGAHIHIGQFFADGAKAAFLCENDGENPSGVPPCPSEGELGGVITAANVLSQPDQGLKPGAFQELGAALMTHNAYVMMHTRLHPKGELRGQVKVTPLM